MDDDVDYEIECPFCEARDIWCDFDCPDVIGTSDSNYLTWRAEFEVLDELQELAMEVEDVQLQLRPAKLDLSGVFEGLDPCWSRLVDGGFCQSLDWLSDLEHPRVGVITWCHPDGGMGSGAYTVWVVRKAQHAAFRRELGEVRRRLQGMFHSRERA